MVWQKVKLGTVLKQHNEKIGVDDSTEYKQITVSNTGEIKLRGTKKGSQIGTKKQTIAKSGWFIYSRLGIHKGSFGIIPANLDGAVVTGDMPMFEINKNRILPDFLLYTLNLPYFSKKFSDLTRGLAQSRIREKFILDLEVELPSIEDQKKVVDKLNNIKNVKENLNKQIEKQLFYITKLHQKILQEAVQGKLVSQDLKDEPALELLKKIRREKEKLIKEGKIRKEKPLKPISEDEIPYELPKGWEWVRLENIVSLLGDGIHGTPNYSENGEYFFINGNNLSNGIILIKDNTKRVSLSEYNKYKKDLNEKTVLVSINGTLGNVAFYNNEKIILGKSACYFNLLESINKHYLKILINTEYFLNYAIKNATGTTIKNVSLQSMRLFPVPLPPLSEQKRIVEKVDKLMALCNELEKQVKENQENSERLMEAVLREIFQ